MGYELVANDRHDGACEDPTPHVTIRCDCGQLSHIHRAQVPPTNAVGTTCDLCGQVIVIERRWLLAAIERQ